MLPRAFPERAFSMRYAMKDLSYALAMADAAGVAVPGAQLAMERLRSRGACGSRGRVSSGGAARDRPAMTGLPDIAAWHARCVSDPVLAQWLGELSFAIEGARFRFAEGQAAGGGDAAFALHAPAEAWAQFFTAVPPRHHHNVFAMLARVNGCSVSGDQMAFRQYAHVVRRVLEIGRWVATGQEDRHRCHSGRRPASRRRRIVAGNMCR